MNRKLKIILVSITILFSIFFLFYYQRIYLVFKLLKVENKISDKLNKDIILINISNGDRAYLAKIIDSVARFNPKVLVLDAFFFRKKEKQSDELLANALKNGKVIAGLKLAENGSVFRSNRYFERNMLATGAAVSIGHQGMAVTYKPLNDLGDGKILEHFSVAISKHYDKSKTYKFLQKIKTNQEYIINYTTLQNNFQVIPFQDFSFERSDIEDKIALLCYLGPTDEDTHLTPIGLGDGLDYDYKKGKMYGGVIIANQILMILNESELVAF